MAEALYFCSKCLRQNFTAAGLRGHVCRALIPLGFLSAVEVFRMRAAQDRDRAKAARKRKAAA